MASLNTQVFSISDIATDSYKESIKEITKRMRELSGFTEDLERKVDALLKAQETEFVLSYKQHMFLIREQFRKLEAQIREKQEQILEYKSQGKVGNLLKRVAFLENQEKKQLNIIQKKSQEFRALLFEKNMILSESKMLEQKIKELSRGSNRPNSQAKGRVQRLASEPKQIFSTEVTPSKFRGEIGKILIHQKTLDQSEIKKYGKTQCSNPEISPETSRLRKQISHLKKHNKQLASYSGRCLEQSGRMQKFFVEVVNEIKRNISCRKNTKYCTLEDFRKEDKLELLIRVLSNDDILVHLHQKLFENRSKIDFSETKDSRFLEASTRDKIRLLRKAKKQFPTIQANHLH